MSIIDRLATQDAARTYAQNHGVARSGAQQAGEAHHAQQRSKCVDPVTPSDSARLLAAAREVVKNAPDMRDQKIVELKQHVSDGTYNVPSRVLACRMLDSTGCDYARLENVTSQQQPFSLK